MKSIDWHAGFVDAMRLELLADEDSLTFEAEYHIANRAQRIDLLIIKKAGSPPIVNEIGEIFDKFNIVEYKSPEAELTIGDFYKTLSYTCIYLEELHKYDEYGRDAFTMTLVRQRRPIKLIKLLKRDGYEVIHKSKGIYEIRGHLPFRTQLIISSEWDDEDPKVHTWLRGLTNKGTKSELQGILDLTPGLDPKHKMYADGVMNVFADANEDLIIKSKEEPTMCDAINRIFAEETAAEKKRADEAEAKLNDAEIRASNAETRANNAETRASNAEIRANNAEALLGKAMAEIAKLKAAVK